MAVKYNICIKDIDLLVEGQWDVWSCDVQFCFLEAGLVHYLDGTGAPVEADPRKKHDEWATINSCIIGTLGQNVFPTLKQQLTEDMSAMDAWKLLRK